MSNVASVETLTTRPSVEVDNLDAARWAAACHGFADFSIYQSASYETVISGAQNISHLVLRENARVVAAAQVRIVRIPFLRSGVAYVRWGPLWTSANGTRADNVFREIARALRAEYVERRRLCLRIVPRVSDDESRSVAHLLEEEGYEFRQSAKARRTIVMDLRPTLEDLLRGVHHKWRYNLNKARRQHLELVEGHEEYLFEDFERIYEEMVARKRFMNFVDIGRLKKIQQGLPTNAQMKVFLCKAEGRVCAGGICSALGDTAIYLFGATSSLGLTIQGSYLVHWRMLEWVKEMGCLSYDLNGIDQAKNPGGYQFKTQLAATHGREVQFVGQFDAYPDVGRKLAFNAADSLRSRLRKARQTLARWSR